MQISTDERFYDVLVHLSRKFHKRIRTINQRYFILLSDKIDHYQLLDSIVYQITTTMKSKYLFDKLTIKNQTLIQVLNNYDHKTDLIIATSLIKITPIILLDAFYDFGINKLKQRWDEVIALVNDNHTQLTQPELFNELLRFLILNMEHKIDEAHVVSINQQPVVCNNQLKPLKQTSNDIISCLINAAPRQIFIHADHNLATETINQIQDLFPNCVCIEYRTVL